MNVPPHLQRLLDLLNAVTASGGGWQAQCPAHEDRAPSLSIALGDDGRALVRCHAGCETSAVVKGIGLTMRDLFAPSHKDTGHAAPGKKAPRVFDTFQAAIDGACPRGYRFTTSWHYRDARGESVFHIVRYDSLVAPADGQKPEKTFRPISRDGDGFVVRDPAPPLPLYRLPELLAAQPTTLVYMTEGEKACDALAELGLVATTTAHGAKCPKKTDLAPLAGRNVVVLPDADEAGEKYATELAARLIALTPPASVQIVRLPELPPKGDAVEYVAARRASARDDAAIREEIERLALAAPKYEPPAVPPPGVLNGGCDDTGGRPRTDTGNAERLSHLHGADLRWVHKWRKPLVWDGRRWRLDDLGRALAMTKETARSILKEAAAAPTPTGRDQLIGWARASESAQRRRAMLDLVGAEDGIPMRHDDLDVDPWLLNVRNGTLDLRTGALRKHLRDDLITKLALVNYEPGADAPTWTAFLERVLPIAAVRLFIQRAVGMSLSGDVSAQVLLFLHGLGANGKSVFLRVLQALLGCDYSHQAPTDLLIAKLNRGHPTELADLFRMRLVVCMEIASGLRLDEQLVKQLTGGDLITARRMREDFWSFAPTHKLWIAGNHKPVIRGTDEAIWRRIRLIPFAVTIPENERDGKLLEKLCAELPGILNWAVDGCALWRDHGLDPPTEVLEATAAYRDEQDALADFLAAECTYHERAKVTAKDLYTAYLKWCTDSTEEPLKQRTFGGRMTERGVEKKKTNGVYVYFGIGLRSDAPA